MEKTYKCQISNYIPFIGIIIFIGLYIFSSTLYPGGSQANINSIGFDWVNNYWCNLMNDRGINGQQNPAKPFSIFALIVLCLSLMVFFIQFAKTYSKSRLWQQIIMVCGILSMSTATLIFTKYHDLMTSLSTFFGLFVVIGIIREINKSDLIGYKISGVICMILLGLNNYIYYTNQLIEVLPLLQKVTSIIVLIWIIGLNFKMNKEKRIQLNS